MLFDNFFYEYIDADSDFTMDTDWAYDENALSRKKEMAEGMKEAGLGHLASDDWYIEYFVPNISIAETAQYQEWLDTSTSPIPLIELQNIMSDKFSVSAPKMFEELSKRIEYVYGSMAVMVGEGSKYVAHKHFHPRAYNSTGELSADCRTVTVVVPYKITGPVTEKICFNPQTFTPDQERELRWIKHTHSEYTDVKGEVFEIKMPDAGQYLIFDFNSSSVLHWTEQEDKSSTNEFLCLLFQLPMKF